MISRDKIRAAISDAYYDARNDGSTMETAADNAADRVMALLAEPRGSVLLGARVNVHMADRCRWVPGIVETGFRVSGSWWYDVRLDEGGHLVRAPGSDVKLAPLEGYRFKGGRW